MQLCLRGARRRCGPACRYRIGRACVCFLAAAGVTWFDLPASAAAEPDNTLEILRAADRARETDATEQQDWAEEKARLELLLAAVKERIAAAQQRKKTAQEILKANRDTGDASSALSLQDGAIRIAVRIETALDSLARQVPPGLIPPRGPKQADPREALDQALHRLERAERGVGIVAVSIAPGRLTNGEPKSVEVLRLGGVAAWWRSLDGAMGGEAEMVDGQLRLHRNEEPGVTEAIERASAIAKGRRAPEIVVLPVRYARTSTGAHP